ncbi:MAG: ribbon-helix-helix domain-containing protein [Pseudomonadota bacterium]
MDDKVATNIRLDKKQLGSLKRIAVEKGKSLAVLFREIVADYLVRAGAYSNKNWKKDPFFQMGQKPGRSGMLNVSEEHDAHLYKSGD